MDYDPARGFSSVAVVFSMKRAVVGDSGKHLAIHGPMPLPMIASTVEVLIKANIF